MPDAGESSTSQAVTPSGARFGRFNPLDIIEWLGNKLPDPVTLFALGALVVMALSWIASETGWEVEQRLPQVVMEPVLDAQGQPVLDPATREPRLQPAHDADGQPLLEWRSTGRVFSPTNLLTRDGIYWALTSMVDNFRLFPPLGIVLVTMLGIGVAERVGLLGAALTAFMLSFRRSLERVTPRRWNMADKLLTPAMVFIGVMSSLTIDAGYVVLPPLAAALYKSVGRSPLAGLAAVFAGVSAGFNANLVITGLDPMLAEFTAMGAAIVQPNYRVNPACNWWFMIVSALVITLTGWFVTSFFVERRLGRRPVEEGGPAPASDSDMATQHLRPQQRRGLAAAGGVAVLVMGLFAGLVFVPGMPLYTYKMPLLIENGQPSPIANEAALAELEAQADRPQSEAGTQAAGEAMRPRIVWVIAEVWRGQGDAEATAASEVPDDAYRRADGTVLIPGEGGFDRWVTVIVPLLFIGFLLPGLAYGIAAGEITSDKSVAKLMMDSMAAMAPIILLAFVAGQFIGYFNRSGLAEMTAAQGGMWLGMSGMSTYTLIIAFIVITLLFNLFFGSMSAKYALFAPIFVPMFMLVGISPELTQAAYRIGDSVSNIITPLNAYLVIILAFMQKYVPRGGMGTLVATMFPYTVAFTIVWTIMLLLWMTLDLPLGIDGGLWYDVTEAVPTPPDAAEPFND